MPLGRRAERLDRAALIDRDDRIGNGLENRLEARLAVPCARFRRLGWLPRLCEIAHSTGGGLLAWCIGDPYTNRPSLGKPSRVAVRRTHDLREAAQMGKPVGLKP